MCKICNCRNVMHLGPLFIQWDSQKIKWYFTDTIKIAPFLHWSFLLPFGFCPWKAFEKFTGRWYSKFSIYYHLEFSTNEKKKNNAKNLRKFIKFNVFSSMIILRLASKKTGCKSYAFLCKGVALYASNHHHHH